MKDIEEDDQRSTMNLDELRAILSKSKADVWSVIDTAITMASLEFGEELKNRRDKIVEKLYFSSSGSGQLCRSCGGNDVVVEDQQENNKSPLTPESNHRVKDDSDDEEVDPFGGLFDDDEEVDEQSRILKIRDRLQDLNQGEDSLTELLQELADMDITYTALKETDIGRHVNRFRKHPSVEVRKLVKFLVRKWKEVVDEWVQSGQDSAYFLADGDSPQQVAQPKSQENGHYKGSKAYSPNPPNGASSSEKTYSEIEVKPKARPKAIPPREAPSRPQPSAPKSASAPPPSRNKEPTIDQDRLNSARRRLQENYQEAENAKKQRTIQVMDIHELPKPRNAYFAKNKGGFQGRHR